MKNPLSFLKSSKGLNPSELITKREDLATEIKNLWNKIYKNNIIPVGYKAKFDLDAVYKSIVEKENELIETKIAIQAINIGFTSVKQLPKNCAYNNIYTLQQLKERKVKLDKIPTKKEEKESAVITRGFIEKEIKSISDINKDIQEKIDNFNSAAKIAS